MSLIRRTNVYIPNICVRNCGQSLLDTAKSLPYTKRRPFVYPATESDSCPVSCLKKMDLFANNTTIASNSVLIPSWNYLSVFLLLCICTAFILNSFLLLVFFARPVLVTPFTVCLIFLLISNLIYVLLTGPFEIIPSVYGVWTLGSKWCTFCLYLTYVIGSFVYYAHLNIALNRFWALFFPVNYRRYYKNVVAVYIVLVLILYLHVIQIPFLVLDAMYYRLPELENGCMINNLPQWHYAAALTMGVFAPAVIMPVLINLVICIKLYCMSGLRIRDRNTSSEIQAGQGKCCGVLSCTQVRDICRSRICETAKSASSHQVKLGLFCSGEPKGIALSPQLRERQSTGFTILTLLILSSSVSYLPTHTFFEIWLFVWLDAGEVYNVFSALWHLENVLDPLYFIIALPDLRKETLNILSIW